MRYEVKKIDMDPFDLMCGECPVHELEYWEAVTEEELLEQHAEMIIADKYIPERDREALKDEYGWEPAEEDFNEWLEHSIRDGYIRRVV